MDVVEKSLKIALKAYAGQRDKAGKAYILHPIRIMLQMDSDYEMAVALLHDVVEDSNCSGNDLLAEGIPPDVVDAVLALSKRDGETYDQFIDRVAGNALAVKVKLADIEDNINVLRLDSVGDKDLERVAKYHKAWKKLKKLST
ncbi:GTP pyrophosphokinase [Halopseudomonas oceani]|uniref:GTP pyrophosphokinase n=1 Tax=Halopseudomonas oceani TaxID=1708783 RepID=UPI002AA60AD5|nr:GTP pyrophosphokinase [Halopseudomonas oceani]